MKHAVHNTKCTMQICRIGVVQQCYKMDTFLLKYVKFVNTVCIMLLCIMLCGGSILASIEGLSGVDWSELEANYIQPNTQIIPPCSTNQSSIPHFILP